jgi:Tfp pilus assembly protein PilZ
MSQERRATPRARVPGTFVHCDGAAGEHIQADVLDLSAGGLFIPTPRPLAAGKRVTLRLQVGGVSAPWWSALGRVIWVRESGKGGAPAGMGVKILDIEEDGAVEQIGRLVQERLTTSVSKIKAPARERTVLGIGTAAPAPATTPPPAAAAPARPAEDEWDRPTVIGEMGAAVEREKTMLGVGTTTTAKPLERERSVALPDPDGWDVAPAKEEPPAVVVTPAVIVSAASDAPPVSDPPPDAPPPAREATAPIDLMRKVDKPRASEPPDSEEPLVAAGVPRGSRGGWIVLLVILVGAGVAAYRFQDRWLPRVRAMMGAPASGPAEQPASTPAPAPSASASAAASAPAPRASASSMATASSSASAKGVPSNAPAIAKPPAPIAPPQPPAPPAAAPAKKADDNPY